MRRTKIVCTLGPASARRETVVAMVRAGMDVARLNTGHGTMTEHLDMVQLVRDASQAEGRPVAVLMDLAGPKLRTGETRGGAPIQLESGSITRLTAQPLSGSATAFSVDYPRLVEDVRAGDRVLLDDGKIELEVEHVETDGLLCRVVTGGQLGAHKGVSFPNTTLTMPALTDKDREYVAAGVRAAVDFFALSFVRDAEDIARTRDLLHSLDSDTPIIAKIERRQAVENLDAILAEADGAMVARGDLGVELPPEDVPIQQRRIIASAGRNMIPVITATQMLESMVDSPRPTRAESSDVANAVWDLSDALMLSQETAVGRYPVETVAMMDRIIRRAESAMATGREMIHWQAPEIDDHSYVVALAARRIVESDPNMRAVVCFTRSGYSAFLLSKVHPNAPIYAVTPNEPVYRRLALARSVTPILAPVVERTGEMLEAVDRLLSEGRHVGEGEEVVVVGSMPLGIAGTTNFLKLHRIGESAAYQ